MEDKDGKIVGSQVLNDSALKKTVTTKRGDFVVKILSPMEKTWVIREIARRTGNTPVSSIDVLDYNYIKALVTLEVAIVHEEAPDWWKNLGNNPSACPDDDLLLDIYKGWAEFENFFRGELAKDRYTARSKEGPKTSA